MNTFQRFRYTADLWNYTVVSDPADGHNTNVYSYARPITLDVTQNLQGRLGITFGEDASDVMLAARLHRVKDINGTELYPGGIYVLSLVTPNLNVFGVREGFRASATLSLMEG